MCYTYNVVSFIEFYFTKLKKLSLQFNLKEISILINFYDMVGDKDNIISLYIDFPFIVICD